jgi:hypothetical protein
MKLDDWLELNKTQTGMTRQAFADKLGVTIGALVGYCNGTFVPRREIMRRIREETLGAVTANDFFHDE